MWGGENAARGLISKDIAEYLRILLIIKVKKKSISLSPVPNRYKLLIFFIDINICAKVCFSQE